MLPAVPGWRVVAATQPPPEAEDPIAIESVLGRKIRSSPRKESRWIAKEKVGERGGTPGGAESERGGTGEREGEGERGGGNF